MPYTSSGQSEQTPDVSILLLTYNRAKFLPDTFDAIIRQTYSSYELLICDDGSSDDTKAVCEEYVARDSRFRYLRNEHNLGQFENLNLRIPQARCEFVATLHDGDLYHPTLIEKWRAALLKYPRAGFVFNQYRHLDASGHPWCVTMPFPEIMRGSDFLLRCFADRDLYYPPWGTLMARKSVYEAMNYFNTRYNMCADVDMGFRIAESYDVACVPEPLIDLRSKEILPHQFSTPDVAAHLYTFRAHWNAKKRFYRNQPLSLGVEFGKQTVGYGISLCKRALRRVRG